MQVRINYFAAAREAAGTGHDAVSAHTVGDAVETALSLHAGASGSRGSWPRPASWSTESSRRARRGCSPRATRSTSSRRSPEDDVSTRTVMKPMTVCAVQHQPIDAFTQVGASDGALATFSGVVRNHDHGRIVTTLEYVEHPSAAAVAERPVAALAEAYPDLTHVVLKHRLGTLQPGDTAIYIATASAHRQAAPAACADLIGAVKHQRPVWKRQTFIGGTHEWVNCAHQADDHNGTRN